MKNSMITTPSSSVTVNSGARLHMGFFDLHGGLGRKFGSIGLSLDAPSLDVTASLAETLQVTGASSVPASTQARTLAVAEQVLEKLNLSGKVSIHINQHIPEHAGLGSGTQLALAVGAAITRLHHLSLSAEQIALLTGRGGRSGIGIAAFDHGGLLIDGGRTTNFSASAAAQVAKIPPLLARYAFPADWRILLVFDATQPGIHGEEELKAFSQLPEFSEKLAAYLCRHVLMQAMPAVVERDLTAFGDSIQALQSHVGDYFAPAQGGRYASRLVASVLQHFENIGVACFGQSSWGPTGFAIFENAMQAEKHLQQLKVKFTDPALTWMVCSARNQGARLTGVELP